jgi:transcriptional regulator with XRE-family HTH domain
MKGEKEMNMALLKLKRKSKHISQLDLANHFKYTRQNVSNKERGLQPWKLSEIKELMSILDLTPEEVINIFID